MGDWISGHLFMRKIFLSSLLYIIMCSCQILSEILQMFVINCYSTLCYHVQQVNSVRSVTASNCNIPIKEWVFATLSEYLRCSVESSFQIRTSEPAQKRWYLRGDADTSFMFNRWVNFGMLCGKHFSSFKTDQNFALWITNIIAFGKATLH